MVAKSSSKKSSHSMQPIDQVENDIGQLSVDVYESAKNLIILAPIAGVKISDINISVSEDVLTIQGHRKLEAPIAEDEYLIQECFWGEFSRSIVLPDNVETANITASFKDGILKISIPKSVSRNKTKLIRIKQT